MSSLLIAVDGTGSRDWRRPFTFEGDCNSHVLRFQHSYLGTTLIDANTHGPTTDGSNAESIRAQCENEVYAAYNAGVRTFDFVGHSRGGHIVLRICDNLAGRISKGLLKDARIRFVGLFDALDRTPRSPQTTTISSVVGVCAHAVRSRWTLNRLWFGNTGRSHDASTRYYEEIFGCSHGGIGGDPASGRRIGEGDGLASPLAGAFTLLISAQTEQRESARAWDWMKQRALAADVPLGDSAASGPGDFNVGGASGLA